MDGEGDRYTFQNSFQRFTLEVRTGSQLNVTVRILHWYSRKEEPVVNIAIISNYNLEWAGLPWLAGYATAEGILRHSNKMLKRHRDDNAFLERRGGKTQDYNLPTGIGIIWIGVWLLVSIAGVTKKTYTESGDCKGSSNICSHPFHLLLNRNQSPRQKQRATLALVDKLDETLLWRSWTMTDNLKTCVLNWDARCSATVTSSLRSKFYFDAGRDEIIERQRQT